MPKVVSVTTYQYAELDEAAQAKAREWYIAGDDDTDLLSDMYQNDLPNWGLSGIKVYFSLGYSQSDDVNFKGDIDLEELTRSHVRGDLGEEDAKYYELASYKQVCELYARIKELGGVLQARYCMKHHGGGSHSTYAEVELIDWPPMMDDTTELDKAYGLLEDALTDLFRYFLRDRFMKMGYAEIEYRNSEEVVAENIEANEYEFTKDGKRFAPHMFGGSYE